MASPGRLVQNSIMATPRSTPLATATISNVTQRSPASRFVVESLMLPRHHHDANAVRLNREGDSKAAVPPPLHWLEARPSHGVALFTNPLATNAARLTATYRRRSRSAQLSTYLNTTLIMLGPFLQLPSTCPSYLPPHLHPFHSKTHNTSSVSVHPSTSLAFLKHARF